MKNLQTPLKIAISASDVLREKPIKLTRFLVHRFLWQLVDKI